MRTLLGSILLAGLAACNVNADETVDNLLAAYSGAVPGAAVLVIKDGETVLARGYGMANIEAGVPVTADTSFRLASISKQFTATAILMLVDRGRLDLDDAIGDYFPEFPQFTHGITIRHMLQHNSGLEDYEPLYDGKLPDQITDAGVVDIIGRTTATYFEPGSQYRYSNSAYAILSVLVERLSAMPYPAFLEDNIFRPLGMTHTVAHQKGISSVFKRATGYRVTEQGVEEADQSPWSAVLGDGGIYTSISQLAKWDRAQYGDELISPQLQAAALTPGHEDYGFGLRIDTYKGQRRYHHDGETSGFRNFMQRFPDQRLTVIVLSNRAEPDVQPLAEKIADLYL